LGRSSSATVRSETPAHARPAGARRNSESNSEWRASLPAKCREKSALLQNEKEFRAGVERLYQLTSDLRDEVQKTMTTEVLSVRMYKKTEEIEKLAKQLKSKARG